MSPPVRLKEKASCLRFPAGILNLATRESFRKEETLRRCCDFTSAGGCGCGRRLLIVWGGRRSFGTLTCCQVSFNAATADRHGTEKEVNHVELCPFPDLGASPDSEVSDGLFKCKTFTCCLRVKR